MGHFTKHARVRAKERYDLDLSPNDMGQILRNCLAGRYLLGRNTAGGLIYLGHFNGKTIVPVINQEKTCIITFMEPDYFVSGQTRKHHQAIGAAKQKCEAPQFAHREYRRERITIRQAQEEL